jgi:hypothetical protein
MESFISFCLEIISRLTEKAAALNVAVGVNIPYATHNNGVGTYSSWGNYLSDIYHFAQYIGVSLAILMIVYSGILYVTSEGDSSKLGTAKEITIGALVGLAMLFMINYLAKLLGVTGIAT